jgi:CRISPR type IV-associated protein Csf3
MMRPLRVTARIAGAIVMPGRPIALDALLAAAVVIRDAIPPAYTSAEVVDIEIPIAREPGGRFHLASCASIRVEERETRYVNKRPPIAEAQLFGAPKLKRMQISAGPSKGYRIPMEALHLEGDRLDWWCVGDEVEVPALLALVTSLGKKRGVGIGRVREWSVEPCKSWGDGFPVVAPDGTPMRPLPLDWPGVRVDAARAYACLRPPYWLRECEVECFVPAAPG